MAVAKENNENVDIIASQIAAEQVNRMGNAAIESFAGMETLKNVAKQYINCDDKITQGRLFEVIESTKFNVNAAKAGKALRAVTTEALGQPHAAADIVIRENGHVLREIQAKSSNNAARLTRMVANPKYNKMDRLINKDKVDKVKELASKRANSKGIYSSDYAQAKPHITGELNHGGISSGGTTYDEALRATKHTQQYAFEQNLKNFASGAYTSMLTGALAGAFVGGGMSIVGQGVQLKSGNVSKQEAARAITETAVNSATKSAVIGGVAYGFRFIGKNSSFMMNGNTASTLAMSAVHCTELTYRFLKGDLTTEEYLEQVGGNAVSAFSGIVLSAAAGVLFGPVGAAVGGTVALMGMKQLYKSFTLAREDLALTIEERQKAEQLAAVLIEQIKEEEALLVSYYEQQADVLEDLSGLVRLSHSEDEKIEETLYALTTKLNVVVKYQTREEFDDFMMSDLDLKL